MTNLYILMWIYLVYLGVSFWLFGYNFMSPSVVFFVSMSIMLCVAYYAANNMQMLFAINMQTFTIFAWGGFFFLAAEFMVYAGQAVRCFRNAPLVPQDMPAKPEPLFIHWQIQVSAMIFLAVSCVLAFAVLYMNTGGITLHAKMKEFRSLLFYHPENIKYLFIIAQLYKVNLVISNLFGYVMLYNMTVCNIPARKLLVLLACVMLYAIFSVFYTCARQSFMEVWLCMAMMYITINMRPGGKEKIFKFVLKLIPVLILTASFFTAMGVLVGRNKTTTKSSSLQFVEYLSGGLYSFNLHVDNGASSKYFGQSTFSYVYLIPQHLGLMPKFENDKFIGKFELYGNMVTIFGRWHEDFGAVGVCVMACIVSTLYSLVFYRKLIYSENQSREHHLTRIYYCQFMTGLMWAGTDDRVCALFTAQSVVFLALTAILYKILVVGRFKLA
ncbi:MAG: oligosaccharide repeat unit polymerase [Synergistaceae bacterium]|nr:oligosaccharide repeat unit polymerase [Synergistaceae bacterium]